MTGAPVAVVNALSRAIGTMFFTIIFPSPSSGEVSPSTGDGGERRRGSSLRFQIMIFNLPAIRLGLSPSVADYRATSSEDGGGKFEKELRPSRRAAPALRATPPRRSRCRGGRRAAAWGSS